MGEWGRSVKEIRLIEFQQWIGKKIPTEEAEQYNKPFSTNQNTLKSRKRRKNKKEYEEILRQLREWAKSK